MWAWPIGRPFSLETRLNMKKLLLLAAATAALAAGAAHAQEPAVLNLYSARHYASDEQLYDGFTQATGIKINRVDADDAGIIARLKAEGSASPADVILLVDAARLWRGEHDGLFQPVRSKLLDEAIPASLRAQPAADGGIPWFGFSTRARVIVYDKVRVQPADVASYADLGDARNKGKLCIRSGSHPYNLRCTVQDADQGMTLAAKQEWLHLAHGRAHDAATSVAFVTISLAIQKGSPGTRRWST